MTEDFKVLGQTEVTDNGTYHDLYTVPSGKRAVISSLMVCNLDGSAGAFNVLIAVGGAGFDNKQVIYSKLTITSPNTFSGTLGITLAAGDVIRVALDSGADCAFSLYGSEITP